MRVNFLFITNGVKLNFWISIKTFAFVCVNKYVAVVRNLLLRTFSLFSFSISFSLFTAVLFKAWHGSIFNNNLFSQKAFSFLNKFPIHEWIGNWIRKLCFSEKGHRRLERDDWEWVGRKPSDDYGLPIISLSPLTKFPCLLVYIAFLWRRTWYIS